jgi:hypothetical protein
VPLILRGSIRKTPRAVKSFLIRSSRPQLAFDLGSPEDAERVARFEREAKIKHRALTLFIEKGYDKTFIADYRACRGSRIAPELTEWADHWTPILNPPSPE